MIKRITGQQEGLGGNEHWLDLDYLAQVEVTSEEASHPIEAALLLQSESGWRAAEPRRQTVRLLFERPQRIKLVHLEFQ